ncbi:MAG TPA: transglutaminase family protein [Candidatus Polarisedimenticolia bacterium]|nr:transglutaminase family protein [Candidatus Polarisedimenticolia bacterium]
MRRDCLGVVAVSPHESWPSTKSHSTFSVRRLRLPRGPTASWPRKTPWLSAFLTVFLCANAASSAPGRAEDGLLDRLVAVETGCDTFCPPADTGNALPARIDGLADRLRTVMSGSENGPERVAILNRFVFEQIGVRASQDLRDPGNLLLARVLERRQGYCVGIASLYLVLAERLGLPIFAVATPAHVFLRYDDGDRCINIETLQQGAGVSDDQYVQEQRIPPYSIRKGVFMRNLTAHEFLAQVRNNLGVIYSERRDYDNADKEYMAALRLDPRLATAFYNAGIDRLARHDYRAAVRRFSRSLRLYPTDSWSLNNRGLAYMRSGRLRRARRDFEAALKFDSSFEPAKKNLETLRSIESGAD